MFPTGFNNIVMHHARNTNAPLLFSDVLELVGSENYTTNMSFIIENNLGKTEVLSKDNCPTCGKSATVKNVEEGIIVCERSHLRNVDPLKLQSITLVNEKLVNLLFGSLQSSLKGLQPITDSKYTPYHYCGFDPVGVLQMNEVRILILSSFKRINIRDAAVLQGLITTSIFDYFILLIEGIEDNAEEFLVYNTGEAVHYITFDKLLNHDVDISKIFADIQKTINTSTLSLHAFLKNKLINIKSITNPENFRTLLEYDATLVDRSFKAATSGSSEEFEDIVGKLWGGFLPVTNLGHAVTSYTDGKKIEAPDGIIEVPQKGILELMFYDCKSIGTKSKEKTTKLISQPDEDQFERYCQLFNHPKLQVTLSRGIFIANDFSKINLANKSMQIRAKPGVTQDLQIVYFPLKSLVRLYSRLTQERSKFMSHFIPQTIPKLFGQSINGKEEQKLQSDDGFEIFDTLRKSGTNSVYVIESLVDVFFDYVYSHTASSETYLPYIIDISKKQSERY